MIDPELQARIEAGAQWLVKHPNAAQPPTAALREKFGLSFNHAAKSMALAKRLRCAAQAPAHEPR